MSLHKQSNNSFQVAANRKLRAVIVFALILMALLCIAAGSSTEPVQKVINISGSSIAALISAVIVAATALMTALVSLSKMVNHMNNHLIHHSIDSLENDFTRKENGIRHEEQIALLTDTINSIATKLSSIEAKLDMIEKHLLKK